MALSLLIHHVCFASSSELPQAFLHGVESYRAGDFPSAIESFSLIAEAGIENSRLYYDLGNAHLRNDDLGRAILWYERALVLDPSDPDLRFNHAYALSRVVDEKGDASVSILEVLLFWKHFLGETAIQWIAILLNLMVWSIFALHHIRKKRSLQTVLSVTIVLSLVFVSTTLYGFYAAEKHRFAIILPDAVAVRSGLSEGATELFALHAGSKVTIERERRGFYRIYYAEGKIGWLKRADVGVI